MKDIWYKNPIILFKDYKDFFPKKEMNKVERLNAIARLVIYYAILVIVFRLDNKWLAITICILLLTVFISETETFINLTNKECTKPTVNNPFMNYTLAEQINNPQRVKACPLDEIRDEQLKLFKGDKFKDVNDLWGKSQNDRNFYTMPSTEIINDQEGFAKFVYGDFGKCKSEGKDCLKTLDNRFFKGRYNR